MRKLALLIGTLTVAVGRGQPGDPSLFIPFVDGTPRDTVDLNMDSVPDLLLSGTSEKAVNWRSGDTLFFTRTVSTLSGTYLLHQLDQDMWPYVLNTFVPGDTVPDFWNYGEQEMLPEWAFMGDTIKLGQYGGLGWTEPGLIQKLAEQVVVFQTYENDQRVRGSFTIELLPEAPYAHIVVGTLLHSDVPLIAR
ncbi:MAG: hypothetical protein IPH05_05625 [Flavobacteriales bacterium]|jgi:hypothetical protein|nr:hypothetical protein [Flavobacteriales bacterium]MBK6550858.1 hypothetical protein [Flavobacteriales bacterium]MBK6882413.1 hypothetical protein [Flavobacteriales bacterium]MBK7101373.1 hypothetical protein [Flavobacteriales bacterium]MBK7481922.1 hypothetical protein [Flavobacteriales bacterium]